ncbi:transcriptional regulator GcvA [Brenneria populi subsp. brevivirga]|uniref:transcriptional regulator GcvA n=1 Tax=Brenneria populi TaxID=1505588 RepID=UPI002E18685C|nr:transcriptional regulator GcvA [Brenneria populi subsp. brevivirga]
MSAAFPSLRGLQMFESAARHLSMTAAADELNVTPGAVSLQIRELEETLGVALFIRKTRALALTPQGEAYFSSLRDAFRLIREATLKLRAHAQSPVLTLSCTPTFAVQWLIPRLSDFERRHPRIDVRLSPSNLTRDFARDGIDLAVRHGLGDYPGLLSERLIDDALIPVCHPRLIKKAGPFATPADLRRCTLLHDEHRHDWRLWLEAADADPSISQAGPVFTDSNGAVDAAKAGLGVALVRRAFALPAIEEGELVALFERSVESALAYYLVYPAIALEQPPVAAFRRWLMEMAGR